MNNLESAHKNKLPMRLSHQKYYLRTLTQEDVSEKYLRWVIDKEVTKYLGIRYDNYTDLSVLHDYVRSFDGVYTKFLFGIFYKDNDEHVGNATIYNIDYNTRTFDIGYLIGEKKYWGQNAGLEATLMLLRFGFDDLKLRKFFGGVYANHIMSRFVLKKIGFIQEACLKGYLVFEGKPVDRCIYTMDQEQWAQVRKKFNI